MSTPMTLVAGLGLAIVCFGAAAAIYLLVERPAMNWRERYSAAAALPAGPQRQRDPASA
jgi:hypothetical protein